MYNNQPQNVVFECGEASKQKPKIADTPVCECRSIDSQDPCEDDGDTCDCTSETEECTCCICAENQEFLDRLKLYNETYNTDVKPCLCACKCKKHRKKPCCLTPLQAEERKCKYCFCNKIRRRPNIPIPGDETAEEEEIIEVTSQDELDKTPNVPFNTETGTELTKTQSKKDPNPTENTTKNILRNEDSSKVSKKNVDTTGVVVKSSDSDSSSVCEECKCAKMYDEYLLTHDSCLDLFVEYQSKMKQDLEDYLKDLEERCACGDSLSDIEEEEITEESSICSCLKALNKPEYKSSSSDDKCNCDDSDSVKLNKCQCPQERKLTGTPTCDYGRAQLEQVCFLFQFYESKILKLIKRFNVDTRTRYSRRIDCFNSNNS